MSVKLLDNAAFYGFRVRRTVQGKVYQEYFSLKAGGDRVDETRKQEVYAEALARDEQLKQLQREAKASMKATMAFKSDGSIRGISCLDKQEKSGNVTPIFQLGISSEVTKKIVCTSVSISAYGEAEAWQRVVELYCKHKMISTNSDLFTKLLGAKDATMLKKTRPQEASTKTVRIPRPQRYSDVPLSRSWL